MLTILLLGTAGVAAVAAAFQALRRALAGLPRSNRDWVFY